jgi:hypothetical protein
VRYAIEFGGEPEGVTVTTSGVADRAGFVALVDDLISDARYRAGMTVLVDHSALDVTALTVADLRSIAEAVIHLAGRIGPSPVAIVAVDALTADLVQQFQAFAAPARLRLQLFDTRPAALAWLEEHRL